MVRESVFAALIAGAILAVGCGSGEDDPQVHGDAPTDSPPQRIVSLAPSLTETLFALGLGERVVGVTRYCAYPPEALELPKIGGHLDPSYEALLSLQPDLVVLIPSSDEIERRLESLGVRVLRIDQHDVEGVLESITLLAAACGVPERGADLRASVDERLGKVAARIAGEPRPRAVVVVGHDVGGGVVRSVWAAGPDTFYDGVLQIAGGVNGVEGGLARYPELSREGLASIDPDVVLDVIAGLEERGLNIPEIRDSWLKLVELRAVREGRVEILDGDVMVVPGPRLPEMVENVARALHPELEWELE
jgi:iron complex transport system substrate-binding protein